MKIQNPLAVAVAACLLFFVLGYASRTYYRKAETDLLKRTQDAPERSADDPATRKPGVPEKILTTPTEEPVFVGKPADKRIDWNLWGDWTIARTERLDGKPSTATRFDESWHPRKPPAGDESADLWYDKGRGETFRLHRGEVGDIIVWRRYKGKEFHLSVNRQSYGFLVMTDADGENYLAVRTEGGD